MALQSTRVFLNFYKLIRANLLLQIYSKYYLHQGTLSSKEGNQTIFFWDIARRNSRWLHWFEILDYVKKFHCLDAPIKYELNDVETN